MWINIPPPRYPVSIKYFFLWVIAPIKPFIFTNISKVKNKRIFEYVFNFMNIFLGWPIKITYEKNLDLFKLVDGDLVTYIGRRQYLKLYSKGIRGRNKLLIDQYLLNEVPFEKNDLVIDIGANVGEVSLILSRDFGCSTYSVEPENVEFKCLEMNLKGYNSSFLNSPLWKEETLIPFYSANEELDSSCFETEDYTHVIEKKTATLSAIVNSLDNNRIKLLKLEAEGAEPEILLGGLDVLHKIDYICVDVGPERGLSYETTLVPTVNTLKNHGFDFIKMGHPRLICLFKKNQST